MGSSTETWGRLHPASVAVNLLPRTLRVLRGTWPLLLFLFYGNDSSWIGLFDGFLLLFFFSSTIGSTIVHFFTLRYRVDAGCLIIRSGLLHRRVRSIDLARIQNVERVRNPLHKLTGLVEVRVETAAGRETDGLLSALSTDTADALVEELEKERRRFGAPADEGEPEVLVRNGLADLAWFGATATRRGILLILFGLVMEASTWLDPEGVPELLGDGLQPSLMIGLAGVVVSGIWLGGTLIEVFRYFGFRLVALDSRVIAEQGLFTRRRTEVRLAGIQSVTYREPLLRRLLGFGTLSLVTAAQRSDGGTQRVEAVVPYLHRDDLSELMARVLPIVAGGALDFPHPLALRRGVLRAFWRGLIVTVLALFWFGPWGLIAALCLPLFIGMAVLDHRHQRWALTEAAVISRRGYWNRSTVTFSRFKVQSVEVLQGPILRRWGLGRVVVRLAGTEVLLPLLDYATARRVQSDLQGREHSRPASPIPSASERSGPVALGDDFEPSLLPQS